jgi:hypothetical protein
MGYTVRRRRRCRVSSVLNLERLDTLVLARPMRSLGFESGKDQKRGTGIH